MQILNKSKAAKKLLEIDEIWQKDQKNFDDFEQKIDEIVDFFYTKMKPSDVAAAIARWCNFKEIRKIIVENYTVKILTREPKKTAHDREFRELVSLWEDQGDFEHLSNLIEQVGLLFAGTMVTNKLARKKTWRAFRESKRVDRVSLRNFSLAMQLCMTDPNSPGSWFSAAREADLLSHVDDSVVLYFGAIVRDPRNAGYQNNFFNLVKAKEPTDFMVSAFRFMPLPVRCKLEALTKCRNHWQSDLTKSQSKILENEIKKLLKICGFEAETYFKLVVTDNDAGNKKSNFKFFDIEVATYRQDVVRFLNFIEENYDLDVFVVKDIPIWPVARAILGHQMEQQVLHVGFFVRATSGDRLQETERDLLEQAKIKSEDSYLSSEENISCELAFLGREHRHLKRCVNRGTFSFDMDFEFEHLSQKYSAIKFGLPFRESSKSDLWHAYHEIDAELEKEEWSPFDKDDIQVIENFKKKFTEDSLAPEGILSKLRQVMQIIDRQRVVFKRTLEKIRPKVVFVSHFFSPDSMALIMACNEMGIKTVEIQHGVIGRYHWPYTHWKVGSGISAKLFPDFVWTWDPGTKKTLADTNDVGPNKFIPVLGHNLKMSYLEEETVFNAALQRRCADYEKVILYAGQATVFNPAYLFEAFEETPDDWLWLVRLHPNSLPLLPTWKRIFKEKKLNHVEVDFATNANISEVLSICTNVVTPFSTVAVDALDYSIRPVVTYSGAMDIFKEQIDKGLMVQVSSKVELMHQLKFMNTAVKQTPIPSEQEEVDKLIATLVKA